MKTFSLNNNPVRSGALIISVVREISILGGALCRLIHTVGILSRWLCVLNGVPIFWLLKCEDFDVLLFHEVFSVVHHHKVVQGWSVRRHLNLSRQLAPNNYSEAYAENGSCWFLLKPGNGKPPLSYVLICYYRAFGRVIKISKWLLCQMLQTFDITVFPLAQASSRIRWPLHHLRAFVRPINSMYSIAKTGFGVR